MTGAGPTTADTWATRHADAAARLGSARQAAWLVEEASGQRWPGCSNRVVAGPPGGRFSAMLERRAAGEPLQYVLGRWSFRRLELMVDRRVLIPRPETEQVVEAALSELDRIVAAGGRAMIVADLGTGSGAIALSIAAERVVGEVWATDRSPAALQVASANAAGLGGRAAARVRFAEGDWWGALPAGRRGRVDLAVCNPPYVSSAEMAVLDPAVAGWEPGCALEAGPSGMEGIAAVIGGAPRWLAPGGALVVEVAPHQARQAEELACRAGFAETAIRPDLAGRDRALVARLGVAAPRVPAAGGDPPPAGRAEPASSGLP